MASRRGIAVTGAILAAITAASFLAWSVPQDGGDGSETTFIVSDYEEYLDGAVNIRQILQKSIDVEYQNLRDGAITPGRYMEVADATASQVTGQISEFVTSKPPEAWQSSYINYMESMRAFNAQIVETRVLADLIDRGEGDTDEAAGLEQKIQSLRDESAEYARMSDQARPTRG